MLAFGNDGNPARYRFFFSELTNSLSFDDLLYQAYILISKVGFSYSDVKNMKKEERLAFLKFYSDEMKKSEV